MCNYTLCREVAEGQNEIRMKRYFAYITILLIGSLSMACRQRAEQATEASSATPANVESAVNFTLVTPPAMLSGEPLRAYMVEHYWDKFDFSDTLFISKIEPQQMLRAYAVYVSYMADDEAPKYMPQLMQRAQTSRPMLDYFMRLAETILHDPNSDFRSDEKYIPVLEAAIASPLYDEYERMPYQYDLQIARQNRVGHKANDFRYTLASGKSAMMSDIEADYLLIFMSNPGCAMCGDVKAKIQSSAVITDLVQRGSLSILVLYPDEDIQAWREHLKDYPPQWINAYDKDTVIMRERLYDLKAIPSLYLLDSQKQVLLKDCTSVAQIEQQLMQAEANR